jgi:hypothetical protein
MYALYDDGYSENVKILIENNADVNIQNNVFFFFFIFFSIKKHFLNFFFIYV